MSDPECGRNRRCWCPPPRNCWRSDIAVAPLSTGSTVRVKRARNIDPETLFVVLANGAKVKIAELGGEDGRYWTVPRTALEKVTIDLAAAAAAASAQVAEAR